VSIAKHPARATGFSLVELVVTLVLIGVLAAVALPKLSGSQVYDTLGFSDGTLAALQYAQKSAIAKRRLVCATFTATQVTFTYSNAFAPALCPPLNFLIGPGDENPFIVKATGLAAYAPTPANFNFNPDGSASAGPTISFANGGRPITVEAATGYVHY